MDTATTAYLMTSEYDSDAFAGEAVPLRIVLWTWVVVGACACLLPFLNLS
jgi:hypothetical protein